MTDRPKWEILVGDEALAAIEVRKSHEDPHVPPHPLQDIIEEIIREDFTDADRELYYMRFGERRTIRSIAKAEGLLGHQAIQYRLERLFEKVRKGLAERGYAPENI